MNKHQDKIEQLILELCPNGVAYKELGKVLKPKENISWKYNSGIKYQYIDLSSVDRITHKISNTTEIDENTAPSRAQQIVYTGDVIYGTTRPTLKRYSIIGKEFDGQIVSTGFCVLRPNNEILTDFIFHLLGTTDFDNYVEFAQKGASYPSISDAEVKKFIIPVPPLAIQKEIVKILNKFTELEARKKQYEYYQKALLSPTVGTKFRKLSEIAKVTIGEFVHKNKQNPNGQYPVFNGGITETGYYDEFNNAGNKIIISARGANAGFVNKIFRPYWAGNSCYSVEILDKDTINWMYVFYYLKSNQNKLIGEQQRGGIPAVSKKQVENFEIPMLNLPEQNHIVATLDKFETLVNDISIGIPAELNARRQQYEYYRNKLLTFKEYVG